MFWLTKRSLLRNIDFYIFNFSDLHRPSKTYKELEPLEKGNFLDVVVTHADDPHSIYIQRVYNQYCLCQ